ncbi:NAD-glutamate dehydrogenase domain-containing protein [Gordonia sp. VNK21]|uniref:NAD-glutamate dehydrogenase domain-containing protein n=1 Tax=Gordonia sp. VNK21 TaxID=3382483 RepID=UPI0038D4E7B7
MAEAKTTDELISAGLLRYGGSTAEDAARLGRHVTAAAVRGPGEAIVATGRDPDGRIEIVVVADDAPLLVESVLAVAADAGLAIAGLDHPIMPVHRDADGRLTAIGDGAGPGEPEAWVCVRAYAAPGADLAVLREQVRRSIALVGAVARDADAIRAELIRLTGVLRAPERELGAYRELLRWLADQVNFSPVGYARSDGSPGLGIWSDPETLRLQPLDPEPLRPVLDRMGLPTAVLQTRYPLVLRLGDGEVEHQVVGVLTSVGRHRPVQEIPVVREKAAAVLAALGLDADSFSGAGAVDLLQNYPLFGLFATPTAELSRRTGELLDAGLEQSARLYLRAGRDGHTISVLTYIPRDRYSSGVRRRIVELLERELGGTDTEFATQLGQSPLAQLQLSMRTSGRITEDLSTGGPLQSGLQRRLADAVRSWDDRVRRLAGGEAAVAGLLPALSERYREERAPAAAAQDLAIASELGPDGVHVQVRRSSPDPWLLTVYLADRDAALTDVLPMLSSLGLTVLDEHPYLMTLPGRRRVRIYEFGVQPAPHLQSADEPDEAAAAETDARISDAFTRMWLGHGDVDRLNELVLRAGLTSRQVAVLRTYVRYLQQCGIGLGTTHVAEVLGSYPEVAASLVEVFTVSFDPAVRADERSERRAAARAQLGTRLAGVLSLDADRVLSALASVLDATVRTNYFRSECGSARELDEAYRPTVAIKLRTRDIPQAPQPRPLYEIFVHSPRVEGVHLRFGAVARGGCRWSDRRDDFRTEILGLVKAQAVKNAVIVPAGAKGGFVVRRPPPPTGDQAADQDAQRSEGVACYQAFVAALIALTDDLDHESGRVLPPPGVVRRDGDDPYLVMAADKGTASFSDIANDIAGHYGFWLGDAFASGGSVGYDHKAMGITARGAWEAVKRHFRELGVDVQKQDFTAVGVGDMSGDVFGNGMLASRHTRLVAAFDHRHVFVDPDPDAAASYTERARLYALPRSSWADYDPALISAGGGVWPRSVKAIPVSPEMRAALGLGGDVHRLSPPELIRAILLAPVDLIFNGGIGTYIKASAQSHAEVGDKANDPVRVDANLLRAKVVGEGGNLGVTELGRIEADLHGVRINTDAMDNSAGVDCSDHEVNIKILLDSQVSAGALDAADRDDLLASLTDEVAELVLADNIAQNAELGCARARSDGEADLYARLLEQLARDGVNLELEALPQPETLLERSASAVRRGLTSPELATVMAQVKLRAKAELAGSALLDGEFFEPLARDYFPQPLAQRFGPGIAGHRLRPEIIATVLINQIVDDAGMTYLFRMTEATTARVEDAVRAYSVTAEVFGVTALIDRLRAEPVPVTAVDAMTERVRELIARAPPAGSSNTGRSRWRWPPNACAIRPSPSWPRGSTTGPGRPSPERSTG